MSEPKTLAELIALEIRTTGPLSLANYMRLCLTHPKFGYYKNADPLGPSGDFITAPEISQMFGEFIGLWIANTWQTMGAPERFTLLELGPGRGTLMQDALRVMQNVPGLLEAKQLVLLETNKALISQQLEKLLPHNPTWIEELPNPEEADDIPIIIVANEFFDALPIRQYQKHNGNWHERSIGLKDNKLSLGLAPTPFPPEHMPTAIRDAAEGEVWEAGMTGLQLMHDLSLEIARRGGAMLTIDYGYDQTRTGETFQALKNHKFADPLAEPGKADLTAHVDFAALALAAETAGITAHPIITQNAFLHAMGIVDRTKSLAMANSAQAKDIIAGAERLVSEKHMGELFKCLCISTKDMAVYPFAAPKGET